MKNSNPLSTFFHSRVGYDTIRLAGWMRIGYATMVLADRLLLTVDFDHFFFSGIMPYEVTSVDDEYMYSLLHFLPDSYGFYWTLHTLSIVHSVLLLLGLAPRLNLACAYVCMLSFYQHNSLMWFGEDCMFRLWGAMFMFLPLHRITLLDGFGRRVPAETRLTESWPMWPFRLWQFQLCFIYSGCFFGKLANEKWQSGTAMYHIIHEAEIFGGFTPDIIFNRLGPLKIATLSTLLIEGACIVTVWPLKTRMATLFSIVALHIGIELTMSLHWFEWLSILGWGVFLAKPIPCESPLDHRSKESNGNVKEKSSESISDRNKVEMPLIESISAHGSFRAKRWAANAFLLIALPLFFSSTVPLDELEEVSPLFLKPHLRMLAEKRDFVNEAMAYPLLAPLGLYTGVWDLYSPPPDESNQLEVTFNLKNGTKTNWTSPDWNTYNWLQRNRIPKKLQWYDSMYGDPGPLLKDAFLRTLAQRDNQDVISVHAAQHVSRPTAHPEKYGFWDRARQSLTKETSHYWTLNICDDFVAECEYWARNGRCYDPYHASFMVSKCKRSCAFCYDTDDLDVNSRVSIAWPYDRSHHNGTIAKVAEHPKRYLVEWDDLEGYDRYEWLNRFELRIRKFIILSEAKTQLGVDGNVTNSDKGDEL